MFSSGPYQFPHACVYPAHPGNLTLIGDWVQRERRRMRKLLAHTAPGQQAGSAGADASQPRWWDEQTYMAQLPYTSDVRCTQGVGSIMTAEMHYWLTTSAAQGAQLQQSTANTVLLPADDQAGLQLETIEAPKQGYALTASDMAGWSLADLQVVLPGDIIQAAVSQRAQEPLLYLGWPVALEPSKPIIGARRACCVSLCVASVSR